MRKAKKALAKNSAIDFSPNSLKILEKRYLLKDQNGVVAETVEGMFERIAKVVASPDAKYGYEEKSQIEFYNLISTKKFFPNSPTFTGAGTPLGQLAACFVLPIEDDLGKHPDGIFSTLRNAALIQQVGGGNGFSFSDIRPKGTLVKSSTGKATGPIGFLAVYDKAFGEVAQGGVRRGANMAVLQVNHPDIREFIKCKSAEGEISNFNISVAVTDEFMQAVKADKKYDLVDPHSKKVIESPRAREIFELIVEYAYKNGEPGVLFIDEANRYNPVPHLYTLKATNPCVTGDTLVATPRGWLRADAIKEGDSVCTVLGVGKVEKVEVNENVPVFNVHLSDGGVVKVTAAHQFHTRGSREKFFKQTRLDEIKIGEWVRLYASVLPNNPLAEKSCGVSDREYGFLVGVLIGDGCYTPHNLAKNVVRISTHADEKGWNDILMSTFAKVGAEKMYSYVNKGSRSMMMDPKPGRVIADWVKSLPLEPARGPQKTIPEVYINSNSDFLTGLLDGLFSTDGSIDLQSNHPLARFHTSSPELAKQVRRILLMFGVHGRVCKSTRKWHEINGRPIKIDRPKYDVVISGGSLGEFYRKIHLSHPEKQKRLDKAALTTNFTGGNWAARVLKIEPAGNERVYDLYEPHSDTWITDGYVSKGCGEQWLGKYENCCLGSINLLEHLDEDGQMDWGSLKETIILSVRFLDNVVTANNYVDAVPQLRQAAENCRRIGLGFMGLADVMFSLGVRYGSDEGCDFAGQITEFIRYHSMLASIDLARERGVFPAIKGSIYDPKKLTWQAPKPLRPFRKDFGRPKLDWDTVQGRLKKYGIRNAAQTTVAPTGTISTVAGVEGYGCEPAFALAYSRNVYQAAGDAEKLTLTYVSPLFDKALDGLNLKAESKKAIVERVLETGSCQDITELPEKMRTTFVVSADVLPEEHIKTQAAIQAFVDNSISKTCNFPADAKKDDIAKVYMLGWEMGCKGLTVYVAGSRQEVVLETKETKTKKDGKADSVVAVEPVKKEAERGYRLTGTTYKLDTPQGKAFITVNKDAEGSPMEVFANVGKAGSDVAALSEALGRLISGWLRVSENPLRTAKEIVVQLLGIGGSRSVGFGSKRVSSIPDAVAKVLAEDCDLHVRSNGANIVETKENKKEVSVFSHVNMCPECGNASFINEEGCSKCYECGYSIC